MRAKICILIIGLLTIVSTQEGFGQRIKGAVIFGGNITQIDGDNAYGFHKWGLNVGAAAIVPIKKNFSFSLETIYNQKGSNQKAWYYEEVTDTSDNVIDVRTGQYKAKLDYLEVPFLIQYTDKNIITAGVGFSYGRLVNVKEYQHDTLVPTTTLNSNTYDRNDWNVIADLQFRILKKYPKFKFNIRYAYSMSSIRIRDYYDQYTGQYINTRKQYNNVITFRLIYVFNEQPPLDNLR